MVILTQPNTRPHVATHERHDLPFSGLCPFSGNPQEGSILTIEYIPESVFLEVYSLKKYIDSYRGGKGDIRDMEGMVQQTCLDMARTLKTRVTVTAHIRLQNDDTMILVCESEDDANT